MAEERARRRLAAILAADVVGYSRLMEQDEAGTLAALKERRKGVLEPLVAQHQGRIVKVMGDGVLVEFASAVNAVGCAVELQKRMAAPNEALTEDRRIVLRIGINLGDVVVEGGDLYGEGVNVAARLQELADPGTIVVSAKLHDEVHRRLNLAFEDAGEQRLKNVSSPLRIYRIAGGDKGAAAAAAALALPTKPSIAVLPYTNMSSDPEQEVFVDGLTEDLITELSRAAGLFVIARHSTFAYKGKAADVRRIARDLGVRYLVEGSARRAAGRVRINVQLIDALGGDHVWAERFDRSLEDIFAVQDEVTGKIAEALVGRLTAPPARKRPTSLEAYDLCVRARRLTGISPQATHEARVLLERAISLDPGYAEAHRWLAFVLWEGWTDMGRPMEPDRRLSMEMAQRAVKLDPNDAGNRWVLSRLLAYESRWEESDAEFASTIELDPNHADAWAVRAEVTAFSGQALTAIEQAHRGLRLNPYPAGWYYWELGLAQYAARQYEAAVETLHREATYRTGSRRILAASLAQLGRMEEAHREAELFMVGNPNFTISHWAATQPFRDDAMRKHFVDGYRKAGLPE